MSGAKRSGLRVNTAYQQHVMTWGRTSGAGFSGTASGGVAETRSACGGVATAVADSGAGEVALLAPRSLLDGRAVLRAAGAGMCVAMGGMSGTAPPRAGAALKLCAIRGCATGVRALTVAAAGGGCACSGFAPLPPLPSATTAAAASLLATLRLLRLPAPRATLRSEPPAVQWRWHACTAAHPSAAQARCTACRWNSDALLVRAPCKRSAAAQCCDC